MKTCVVGLGLIGGSLALDIRARGFTREIVGVDLNPAHAKQAQELSIVDRTTSLSEAVAEADLIVLATPVNGIERLLPQVLDLIRDHATVTDMGSTKEAICRSVAQHPRRNHYVASHPMAGTENSGPSAAISGLFALKTAVICNRDQSGASHLKRVEDLYRCLDMRLVYMSDSEHDLHAAYVSHLSHISAFVLANTVLDKEKYVENTIFDLAGGGFESTVRLAKSSPEMWADIFNQNRANVLDALENYIAQLQNFRLSLQEQNPTQLKDLLVNANQIRAVLAQMNKNMNEKMG